MLPSDITCCERISLFEAFVQRDLSWREMSGAEALLVVGVVSNVVQFVDFGAKLYARIKEYSTAATGAPKKIKDLAEYISLVSTTLTGLSESGRAVIEHEQTTIQKCLLHAQELDALLDQLKLKSPAGAAGMDGLSWLDRRKSNVEKFWKAFKSIHGESKIEEFQVALQRLFALISFQLQSRTMYVGFTNFVVQYAAVSHHQTLDVVRSWKVIRVSLVIWMHLSPECQSRKQASMPKVSNDQFDEKNIDGHSNLFDRQNGILGSLQSQPSLCWAR